MIVYNDVQMKQFYWHEWKYKLNSNDWNFIEKMFTFRKTCLGNILKMYF